MPKIYCYSHSIIYCLWSIRIFLECVCKTGLICISKYFAFDLHLEQHDPFLLCAVEHFLLTLLFEVVHLLKIVFKIVHL